MKNLLISLVLLCIFTVAIFFGGAVLKVFGTLDGPGVIEGRVLPEISIIKMMTFRSMGIRKM